MVEGGFSVKAVGERRRMLGSPVQPLMPRPFYRVFCPVFWPVFWPVILGSAILSVALPLTTSCASYLTPPCYPASSATPVDEAEVGFSRKTLAWEIDKMAALVDVPDSDEAPSELFLRAQRDMRTEFWVDAAKEFLPVVRGDTKDGKVIRLHAQYDFALSLFRLRYFDEAKRIFRMIADDPKHPMTNQANEWMHRQVCTG
jgi:hypothetical protein